MDVTVLDSLQTLFTVITRITDPHFEPLLVPFISRVFYLLYDTFVHRLALISGGFSNNTYNHMDFT